MIQIVRIEKEGWYGICMFIFIIKIPFLWIYAYEQGGM